LYDPTWGDALREGDRVWVGTTPTSRGGLAHVRAHDEAFSAQGLDLALASIVAPTTVGVRGRALAAGRRARMIET
jgi:hypothetical protein